MSLYDEMLAAGQVTGNHYSDLYTKDTPEAWAIYAKYKDTMSRPQRFRDNITREMSLDFAFCYAPYWDAIYNKTAVRQA